MEDNIHIAFVGSVDHGKSSILGRLLVETGSLPQGKLEQLQRHCQTHAKDFEYAYLIDSLEKEQSQGITIDMARYFLRSKERKFLFIDTPGHLDLLKNMITGTSKAHAALLIIDAKAGIKESTRRHAFLLSFLRISQVIVLINKMDRIDYSQQIFSNISDEIQKIFSSHDLTVRTILPISAKEGDNFINPSHNTPWHCGPSLWDSLCSISLPKNPIKEDFRMPLQDIYRFSKGGDERRIYSGTVTSGSLRKADHVLFSPSNKQGVVASIESDRSEAGFAIGFTLEEPIFIERGEIVSIKGSSPTVLNSFKARIFWISSRPMTPRMKTTLRIHTAKVSCIIEEIHAIYDSTLLNLKQDCERYDIIDCTLQTTKPIALDTHRFILTDSYETICCGVVLL